MILPFLGCVFFSFYYAGLGKIRFNTLGCVYMSPVCHPRKNNRKKPSYLTGDVSQNWWSQNQASISFRKNKNILYRKGFEYQPSLSLSNPQFQRLYFLGGNVAGLAATKILPEFLPCCPSALRNLRHGHALRLKTEYRILARRGASGSTLWLLDGVSNKRLGDLQVFGPLSVQKWSYIYIYTYIPYSIYYGLAICK